MTSKLERPEDYWDRPVTHMSQGDVFSAVPFIYPAIAKVTDEVTGKRVRPSDPNTEELTAFGGMDPGILLNYTCGFVAQPPGTRGYAHNFRLVAPIDSFISLSEQIPEHELKTIRGRGRARGIMYIPDPYPDPSFDGHQWQGDAAVLLYRATSVHHSTLEDQERIYCLSEPAQQILMSLLVQQVTPSLPEPGTLPTPDRTDSWLEAQPEFGER